MTEFTSDNDEIRQKISSSTCINEEIKSHHDDILSFRITGLQSIQRIFPLLQATFHRISSSSSSSSYDIIANDHHRIIPAMSLYEKCQYYHIDTSSHNMLLQLHTSSIHHLHMIISSSAPSPQPLSFVWETSCEMIWRHHHDHAMILSRLHNSNIIENKVNLAFLQIKAKELLSLSSSLPSSLSSASASPLPPSSSSSSMMSSYDHKQPRYLDTYVAINAHQVITWCQNRWTIIHDDAHDDTHHDAHDAHDDAHDDDWWVLKAGSANGGRDIWVLSKTTYESVILDIKLRRDEEYVIQRYVNRPMLWNGKKFHYRCYSLVMGDMSTYLYSMAFVLTAGLDYKIQSSSPSSCASSSSAMDPSRHITNLSVNKRFEGHPGQIPYNIFIDKHEVFQGIAAVWCHIITAASSYWKHQRSKHHFEFFGIDIIVDEFGQCWLIEANRLPGLESSKNNMMEEDDTYDHMMMSLLNIVMKPLSLSKDDNDEQHDMGLWKKVKEARADDDGNYDMDAPLWSNLFAWKAFTRKNRSEVLLG